MSLRINGSISDFPLYTSQEVYFREFKKAGVDGVEIVGGYKNRWAFEKLFFLSKKYNLPIVSFHQPMWSGIGILIDEAFFRHMAQHNVRKVTFHPLVFASFSSRFMKGYFKKIAAIQQKYDILFLLENMPPETEYKKLFIDGKNKLTQHLNRIFEIGMEYGFGFTYDTSHGEIIAPQKTKIFHDMFPSINIIHLSSFADNGHHLPLYEGTFQLRPFIEFLVKKKFKGEVVLEINESLVRRVLWPYDFTAIAKSIQLIHFLEKKS